jgi:hypothetical protein
MDLFVVQERQMPLGLKTESDDDCLTPTTVEPIARGSGVNGGVQYGVFLDGVGCDYYHLKEKGNGRNVDSTTTGKPSPQVNSTPETPMTFCV